MQRAVYTLERPERLIAFSYLLIGRAQPWVRDVAHSMQHAHARAHSSWSRTRTHTHQHTHARTHTLTRRCARAHPQMHTFTHARTHAQIRARTHTRTHSRTHARTQWIRATRWAAPVRPARAGGLRPHMSHAARSVSVSARSRPRYISSAKRWVADARHASTILRRRMFPCACASPPPSLHPRARAR